MAKVKSVKATKSNKSSRLSKEELAEKEAALRKLPKGKRIVPETARQEMKDGKPGKVTVVIKCCEKGCDETRRVATSDLHQCTRCEAHTAEHRNAKRRLADTNGKPAKKAKPAKTKAKVSAVKSAGIKEKVAAKRAMKTKPKTVIEAPVQDEPAAAVAV